MCMVGVVVVMVVAETRIHKVVVVTRIHTVGVVAVETCICKEVVVEIYKCNVAEERAMVEVGKSTSIHWHGQKRNCSIMLVPQVPRPLHATDEPRRGRPPSNPSPERSTLARIALSSSPSDSRKGLRELN